MIGASPHSQMTSSSDSSEDISDSEIEEYKEKPYELLRTGTLKVLVSGGLRCPFCPGKKKSQYKLNDLLQHASGVAKGSASRSAKQKARHLALANYLQNDLRDGVEPVESVVVKKPVDRPFRNEDAFVWPWMGIIVNKVSESSARDIMCNADYWRKKFENYQPTEINTFWNPTEQTMWCVMTFGSDWHSFMRITDLERSFEASNHGKSHWNQQRELPGYNTYCWCARSDDYNSSDPVGEFLRKECTLKTISDIVQIGAESRKNAVSTLTAEIDETNRNLDQLQNKYEEKSMSLSRMLVEKDRIHQAFMKETRELQQIARYNIHRILHEQEQLNEELETKKKKLDRWSQQLNKREALTELEQKKHDEEEKQHGERNVTLQLASKEQKKTTENVLRLIEEQQREKQESLNKILQLEKQLDAKQKLEWEIEELKGKVEVMKNLGDPDDDSVKETIEKLNEKLQEKVDDLADQESLNQTLFIKERQSNDELVAARKLLIEGLKDRPRGAGHEIGIKRMGELDLKPFHEACKQRFPPEEADSKAMELCSVWQNAVIDSNWYPFKVIDDNGQHKYIVDDSDDKLATLSKEWGLEVYSEVVRALHESVEYNPSGRYVIPELWNFKEDEKAKLKDVILFIFKCIKKAKSRKRPR